MKVTKRNGTLEDVRYDKVTRRVQALCDPCIQASDITHDVVQNMYPDIPTSQIDELCADTAISHAWKDPAYETLAARLLSENIKKMAPRSFVTAMRLAHANGLLEGPVWQWIKENKEALHMCIDEVEIHVLNFFGLKTLLKGYLWKSGDQLLETPQYMWMRVACGIHYPSLVDVKKAYEYMCQGYYTHATPTLFNAGSKRPQCSSCYLMGIHDDSLADIYNTLSQTAQVSKWAGGVGMHISHVRAKGSRINGTNGQSDGIIPMLRVFNNTARYVNQGGKRKGSVAVYLEPWHADIMEFLELRLNEGDPEARCRDLFLALWTPDLFMKRLEANEEWSLMCPTECPGLSDVWGRDFEDLYCKYEAEGKARKTLPARTVWAAVLKSQVETGTPYISFKDTCNMQNNQKELGTLKCSNLCVAGDTRILTSKGYIAIRDLENQGVEVWNGKEFSETRVMKTGQNQELMTVKTSHDYQVRCTPYHKFYVETGKTPSQKSISKEIRACDLEPGMRIVRFQTPLINTFTDTMPDDPYTHGLFCADGTTIHSCDNKRQCKYKSLRGEIFCKMHLGWPEAYPNEEGRCTADVSTCRPYLDLYGDKMKLLDHIQYITAGSYIEKENKIRLKLDPKTSPKYFVPINCNLQNRLRWLEGYLDGDGCVQRSDGNPSVKSIIFSSANKKFITDIALLLQTLGCIPKVGLARSAQEKTIGSRKIQSKPIWRACIDSTTLVTLVKFGFQPKRLDIQGASLPHCRTNEAIRIKEVIRSGERGDTWCFNEPLRHRGMFNGLLLGNCVEIQQYTAPDEVAVCNLASLALPKFFEGGKLNSSKLQEVTGFVAKSLDKIIDKNFYPIPEAENSNKRHRPIGIGVQGLADVFHMANVAFESDEAKELNRIIFEMMLFGALTESVSRAEELGSYESFSGSPASQGLFQWDMSAQPNPVLTPSLDWEGLREKMKKGLRNSLLLAPMPTASTSQILGNNECFEPYTSNVYLRRTLAGEFVVVNKHLVQFLKSKDLWSQETRDRLVASGGSVQGWDELTADEQNRFKTVWEISMRSVIDLASDRQQFCCQSQSMNLFVAEPTNAKLSSMLLYAWKKGLKTGMYYLRTKPKARAQQFTLDPTKFSGSNCDSCGA